MDLACLRDVLSFREIIAPHVLIAFYYLGAIGIPVVVVDFWRKATRYLRGQARVIEPVREQAERWLENLPARWSFIRSRAFLVSAALTLFVLAELFWRIMFEFLIAYFQMRDALLDMS